jgi:hypothetical protein
MPVLTGQDREGDDNGLDFWQHQITNCGDDSGCKDRAWINTSGAFFLSIEFQDTGFLLYRFNKASFGTMPRRNDFLIEMQAIAQGVVVSRDGSKSLRTTSVRRPSAGPAGRIFATVSRVDPTDSLLTTFSLTPASSQLSLSAKT